MSNEKRELIARLRDEVSRRVNRKNFSLSDAEMVAACTAGADALQRELDGRRLPLGWVAVPQFPTNEMVDASMIRVPIAKRIPAGATFKVLGARAWDAMIAAAPKLAGDE